MTGSDVYIAENRSPIRHTVKELFTNLPLYFVFIMGLGLLHYEMANVPDEYYEKTGYSAGTFALTAAIPLFWSILALFVLKKNTLRWAITAVIMIACYLGVYFFHRDRFLTHDEIVTLYEYSQFLWVGIFILHAQRTQGFQSVVAFFGVCLLYGMILENSGIIFGYFGESHYRYYLGISNTLYLPAPVATVLGWSIVFYVSVWMTQTITRRVPAISKSTIGMALFTSLFAVSLDFQIDPMASLYGTWWSWDPRLPGWFLGVPFVNFAAWFVAFLPFCIVYYHYSKQEHLTPWQKNLRILLWVPWMLPALLLLGYLLVIIRQGGLYGTEMQIFLEFIRRVMPY